MRSAPDRVLGFSFRAGGSIVLMYAGVRVVVCSRWACGALKYGQKFPKTAQF